MAGILFFPVKADLVVGAAVSLSEPLAEITATYGKQSGTRIRCSFSGSNSIARQIEAGAPIDLFISADEHTMTALIDKKLIDKASESVIAENQLVVVIPAESNLTAFTPNTLLELKRIGIADPQSVPAGRYAKRWMVDEKTWERIQPKIVSLQNVRAALIAAETSNVDAAIVYRTEAVSSKKVRIAYVVPTTSTGPIYYPAGIVSATQNQVEARRFLDFLLGADSQGILVKHGFTRP
ncbi:molybdate ABC transporter substrate-binding protein [Luteolibacter sp. AS25]|uniref:molybdate ABC transporter substrate-binding protein n=1 Tax=Luteolibacter sp. AS25 TaxID=3135776 RepID=UPI00398A9564